MRQQSDRTGGLFLYQIDIPSLGHFHFEHIVFDFNGTLATDGVLMPGICDKLDALSRFMQVHVLTADLHGNARSALSKTHVLVAVVGAESSSSADICCGTEAKLQYIQDLGPDRTIAVGNGSMDSKMLKKAMLGIAVIGHEGLSVKAMQDADLIFTSINDVFDTLLNPMRLTATLRE